MQFMQVHLNINCALLKWTKGTKTIYERDILKVKHVIENKIPKTFLVNIKKKS